MKGSARSFATILSVGMLFSMTACDKKAVENATETTKETTTEPTEETTEESIEESESEETAEDDFGEYYERRKDKMVIISYETYGYYEITMDEFIFEDYSIFDPVKAFGS